MKAFSSKSSGREMRRLRLYPGNCASKPPPRRRERANAVILETAVLDIRAGQSEAFERSFTEARSLIAQTPGYQRCELRRCLEKTDRYLLLVWWDTLESHTEGFRGSPQYEQWRRLLHHYYTPFPEVEHYAFVDGDRVATGGAHRHSAME